VPAGIGIALVFIILLELGLRLFLHTFAGSGIYRPHPVRFWTLRSNLQEIPKTTLEMDQRRLTTVVSTNDLGLRSPAVSRIKAAGTYRILCLGDSTTFGHGIAESESFSRVLESRLRRAYPGKSCEVINGGIPGYSTFQGLNLLKEKGLGLAPDLVIVSYFYSDLITDVAADRDRVHSPEWIQPLQNQLYSSELYLLLRRELLGFSSPQSRPATIPRVPVDEYKRNLEQFITLVRSRGGRVIFINPAYGSVTPPPSLLPYRQAMQKAALGQGAQWLDLDQVFQDQVKYWDRLFLDPVHPASAGHRLIADHIFPALERYLGKSTASSIPAAAGPVRSEAPATRTPIGGPNPPNLLDHPRWGNQMFQDIDYPPPGTGVVALLMIAVLVVIFRLVLRLAGRHQAREPESGPHCSIWTIALAYLVLAALVCYPVSLFITTRILGDHRSDVWKHLWGAVWVRNSLNAGILFPLHTDRLNFPPGGTIYNLDFLNSYLSVPFQNLLGPVAAYNLIILGQLALGGLGVYLLALEILKSRSGAFLAGAGAAFCPFILSYGIGSGVNECLNLGWLALFILFWIRTGEDHKWRNPLLAAFFLFLTTFGSLYYGFFAVFFALIWTLTRTAQRLAGSNRGFDRKSGGGKVDSQPGLFRRINRPLSPHRRNPALADRGRAVRIITALLLGAILVLPLAGAFKSTWDAPDSMVPGHVKARHALELDQHYSPAFRNFATPADYLIAGKGSVVTTRVMDLLYHVVYPGWVILILATIGLIGNRRGKHPQLVPWMVVGVLFFFCSLGPVIYLGGVAVPGDTGGQNPVGGLRLANPFFLSFYHLVPYFPQVAVPARFSILVILALVILAAAGFVHLQRKLAPVWRPPALLLILGLVLGETMLLSPTPFPIPWSSARVPRVYLELANAPRDTGVLDLPVYRENSLLLPGEYFLYQTVHGQRIPYKISGWLTEKLMTNPFIRAASSGCPPPLPPALASSPSPGTPGQGLDELRKAGYRVILVHEDFLLPADRADYRQRIEELLGPGIMAEPGLWRYDLGEGASLTRN